jgi:hypothetical protein
LLAGRSGLSQGLHVLGHCPRQWTPCYFFLNSYTPLPLVGQKVDECFYVE